MFLAEAGTGLRPDPAISRKKEEALFPRPPPSMAAGGLLMGDKKL
jgi:hypothetical protein